MNRVALIVALCGLFGAACAEVNPRGGAVPDYQRDVRPILERHCTGIDGGGGCHTGATPAAGWSALRFTDVIACLGPPAAAGTDGGLTSYDGGTYASRLIAGLSRAEPYHQLPADEFAIIRAWFSAGAPASHAGMHVLGFADPRSPDFHARYLRDSSAPGFAHWAPMLDPNHRDSTGRVDACGLCHDGAPTRPAGATGSARNAPACTSCHDRPGGPLACNTCHGSATAVYPPRDPCLYPATAGEGGAHARHLAASALHQTQFTCATCHPNRDPQGLGYATVASFAAGTGHADGVKDVAFDTTSPLVGTTASYNLDTQTCTVGCHNHGGNRAMPVWSDTTHMTCNDCHTAPPANHPPGECVRCHVEPNATGTALTPGRLHLNGMRNVGNDSGDCTACHVGASGATEGWPSVGSHAAHRFPLGGAPVACNACHPQVDSVLDPDHFATAPLATVTFDGGMIAFARGAMPTYDPVTHTCTNVACHGFGMPGVSPVQPVWGDTSGNARRCGQCHAVPQPLPHTQATNCESLVCHGGEITPTATGPQISVAGRALHQNGVIDVRGAGP